MGSLTFIGKTKHGMSYLHHWGSGWQELVFASHAKARAFATANNLRFDAPSPQKASR